MTAGKSTPEQIRRRFDALVESFSDLKRGQRTAMDSELCLSLIADADTPRRMTQQMGRLRRRGFAGVDLLHKHGPFAAYVGVKAGM